MPVVYILYSLKLNKYYVGRTENLELRIQYHNNPIETRKFTARGIPWELRLSIPCESQAQSVRLENLIKKAKSRKFIESLLANESLVIELLKRSRT